MNPIDDWKEDIDRRLAHGVGVLLGVLVPFAGVAICSYLMNLVP